MPKCFALVRHEHMTRGFYTVAKIYDLDGATYNLPAIDQQFASLKAARAAARDAGIKLAPDIFRDVPRQLVAFAVTNAPLESSR